MGKRMGCVFGKGGFMYLYYREYNFWGGWGIVGMILFFGVGFVFG